VNGHDVRGGGAKDAVRAFHSSKEPLVIEVLRRAPPRADGIMASIVAEAPPPASAASPPLPPSMATTLSSETAAAIGCGKPVPISPSGSMSVTSTTSTQTNERDDEDEVDLYVVDNDDVQHYQTFDMSSSVVSGCYDYRLVYLSVLAVVFYVRASTGLCSVDLCGLEVQRTICFAENIIIYVIFIALAALEYRKQDIKIELYVSEQTMQ